MNKYILVPLVWVLLVLTFGVIGFSIIRPETSRALRDGGIVTRGRIIALERENHRIVRYSYAVSGNSYTGIGHGGGGNPPFDDLSVGNSVRVVYNSTNPAESCMCWPEHDWRVNRAGALFFTLVPSTSISLVLLFILFLISRSNRRSQPVSP